MMPIRHHFELVNYASTPTHGISATALTELIGLEHVRLTAPTLYGATVPVGHHWDRIRRDSHFYQAKGVLWNNRTGRHLGELFRGPQSDRLVDSAVAYPLIRQDRNLYQRQDGDACGLMPAHVSVRGGRTLRWNSWLS